MQVQGQRLLVSFAAPGTTVSIHLSDAQTVTLTTEEPKERWIEGRDSWLWNSKAVDRHGRKNAQSRPPGVDIDAAFCNTRRAASWNQRDGQMPRLLTNTILRHQYCICALRQLWHDT